MNTTRMIVVAMVIAGSGLALHVTYAQQPGIKRTDVLEHDPSVQGREVIQVRVDFEPGVAFGKHSHPGAISPTSLKARSSISSRTSRQ